MKNRVMVIRKLFPKTYNFLVYLINGSRKIFTPYSIYITDSLGGSFKTYLSDPVNINRETELKRGLDAESERTINTVLERIKFYPDEKHRKKVSKSQPVAGGLLPVETAVMKKQIENSLSGDRKKYKRIFRHLDESVFYFYHGLHFLPENVLNYLKNKDLIDIGAHSGDSAIALRKFGFRKTYSVEMSLKSIDQYKKNMAQLKISDNSFELINVCVADADNKEPAKFADTGSTGLSLLRNRGKYDWITVEQKTLDTIASEYRISPGLIKADIEGMSFDFVKGAVGTMKTHRPVLAVAIYHNPYELFEVKPFLEKALDNYTFLIRKLSAGIENNLCHSDIFLIGFPDEAAV